MTKTLHRLTLIVATAYLVAVAAVVFWPTPVDKGASGTLREILAWLHAHGVPKFINYNFVEFSANIVMFIPMGFIAYVLFKKAWVGLLAGAMASVLIELSQALFLPARFSSGWDILANSLGAGIGVVFCSFFSHKIEVFSKPQTSTYTTLESLLQEIDSADKSTNLH